MNPDLPQDEPNYKALYTELKGEVLEKVGPFARLGELIGQYQDYRKGRGLVPAEVNSFGEAFRALSSLHEKLSSIGGSSSTESAASLADGKLTAGEATCPRCRLAALARDTLRARFVAELSDWDRRYDSAERLAEVLLHILTEDGHIIRFDPTHWQPLPPPPNPSARGEL